MRPRRSDRLSALRSIQAPRRTRVQHPKMNRSGEIAAALLLMKPGVAHGIRDARALRCLGRDEIVEHIAGPDYVERLLNVWYINSFLGVGLIDGVVPPFSRY